MADVRTGRVISMLPITAVTYNIGIYAGTEMTGTIYLPDMFVDQMPHSPLYDFERWAHPDRGVPLAPLFEVGNKAIYVMRNDKVVWGGILWGRSYSSGDHMLAITALSWEGYIYYRAFRKSVIFPTTTDKYTIPGVPRCAVPDRLHLEGRRRQRVRNAGLVNDIGNKPWTGKVRNDVSNQPLPSTASTGASPPIELPPAGLKFKDPAAYDTKAFTTVEDRWRGYEMGTVGEQLQTWADANTLVTSGGFEYRVLCWYDSLQDRFRQRYTFGEMEYDNDPEKTDWSGTPTSILNPLLGGDYGPACRDDLRLPWSRHRWSLTEGMEEVATRVIVTGSGGEEGELQDRRVPEPHRPAPTRLRR